MNVRRCLQMKWLKLSATTVQIIYAFYNILSISILLILPFRIHPLTIYVYVICTLSIVLYITTLFVEPGYIGYPEPDAGNKRLCKQLARRYEKIVSRKEDTLSKKSRWKRGRRREDVNSSELELSPVEKGEDAMASRDQLVQQKPTDIGISLDERTQDEEEETDIMSMLRGDDIQDTYFKLRTFGDIPRRWCELCLVSQPIRARHCYEAGQCVLRFDHYCRFTGMVVGQNNHFLFWLWLLFQTVTILSAMLCFILSMAIEPAGTEWIPKLWALVLSSAMLAILFPVLILVGGVFCYQTILVFSNQLTTENTRIPSQVRTWPWYFRYLVLGHHDLDFKHKIRPLVVDSTNEIAPERRNNPFSFGALFNFMDFVHMGLQYRPDRGLERWRLDGVVVRNVINEEPGKGGEFSEVKYVLDGWVKRLYIDEVEGMQIPKSFFTALQNDFSLA